MRKMGADVLSTAGRGLQRDVVYLGWPMAPSYMSPNAGRGNWGSQPMNTAVHRSPNKLWRSNSIFNCVDFELLHADWQSVKWGAAAANDGGGKWRRWQMTAAANNAGSKWRRRQMTAVANNGGGKWRRRQKTVAANDGGGKWRRSESWLMTCLVLVQMT